MWAILAAKPPWVKTNEQKLSPRQNDRRDNTHLTGGFSIAIKSYTPDARKCAPIYIVHIPRRRAFIRSNATENRFTPNKLMHRCGALAWRPNIINRRRNFTARQLKVQARKRDDNMRAREMRYRRREKGKTKTRNESRIISIQTRRRASRRNLSDGHIMREYRLPRARRVAP